MKTLHILIILLFSWNIAGAQPVADANRHHKRDKHIHETAGSQKILPLYAISGRLPSFPGGEMAMFQFIQKHTQYPEPALSHGHEGTVYVSFIIRADGSIDSVKTVKGIGMGCNKAAEAVIRAMPNWEPAYHQGQPVAVSYTVPVKFRLMY